jgi:hypothetical protein
MSKKNIGEKYEYELSQKLGAGAFAEVYSILYWFQGLQRTE